MAFILTAAGGPAYRRGRRALPGRLPAMRALLESPRPATVGHRGGGFIDEVDRRKDAILLEVTCENRDGAPALALRWLETVRP